MREFFFGSLLTYPKGVHRARPGPLRLALRVGGLVVLGLRLDRVGDRIGRIAARARADAFVVKDPRSRRTFC